VPAGEIYPFPSEFQHRLIKTLHISAKAVCQN
jgi:hypothetical protein